MTREEVVAYLSKSPQRTAWYYSSERLSGGAPWFTAVQLCFRNSCLVRVSDGAEPPSDAVYFWVWRS